MRNAVFSNPEKVILPTSICQQVKANPMYVFEYDNAGETGGSAAKSSLDDDFAIN